VVANVPGNTSQPGYLPLRDAAAWAGVSPKTMRRWFGKGLPRHQAGPREKVLVRLTDIETFLTKQATPQIDLGAMVDDVLNGLNGTEG
jgi:predicted site-specific integrase-resolvase